MRFAAFTTVAASAGGAANAAEMLDNLRQQTVLAEELGAEDLVQRVLLPPGRKLQLPRRQHRFLPPIISA